MEVILAIGLVPILAWCIYIVTKYPKETAAILLIGGPTLLSTFTFGRLTADNIASGMGLTVVVVLIATRQLRASRRAIWLAVFPFSLALAISISAMQNETDAIVPVLRYISLAAAALLLLDPSKVRSFLIIARVAAILGALSVLLAPYTGLSVTYIDQFTGSPRTGGLMGHPNFAAYVMSLALLYLVLTKGKWFVRLPEALTLITALGLTGSLGAVLAVAAVWVVSVLLKPTFGSLVLAVIASASVVAIGSVLLERLVALQTSGGASSLTWRISQWNILIERSENYRLTGIGWQQSAYQAGNELGAHSAYVQVFVELGVVGAIIVLAGALIAFAWTASVRVAGLLVLYVALSSVTDPVLLYPSSLVALFAFIGGVSGEQTIERHSPLTERKVLSS